MKNHGDAFQLVMIAFHARQSLCLDALPMSILHEGNHSAYYLSGPCAPSTLVKPADVLPLLNLPAYLTYSLPTCHTAITSGIYLLF